MAASARSHDGRTRRGSTRRTSSTTPRPPGRHRRLRHRPTSSIWAATASASTSTSPATAGARRSALHVVPARVDLRRRIAVVDLLGNGTACLVWSSPLPGDAPPADALRRPDGRAEAAPAGQDRQQPRRRDHASATRRRRSSICRTSARASPWITRLPFPVHVVERVETYDHISRNRFVTRYAYHHGYFDGVEREFRGFGMVEQWDTEEFAALARRRRFRRATTSTPRRTCRRCTPRPGSTPASTSAATTSPTSSPACSTPPTTGEYFREPGLTDAEAAALLLPDTVLPRGLDASRRSARPAARSRARCCARRSTRSTAPRTKRGPTS